MPPRKQTPDVLSEILGSGPAPAPAPAPRAKAAPRVARAPAAGASPAGRPVWEYREVTFHDYGGYRPRCVDGQELPDWKRQPAMREYLNQLGGEGWELAGLGPAVNREVTAYFKRPK